MTIEVNGRELSHSDNDSYNSAGEEHRCSIAPNFSNSIQRFWLLYTQHYAQYMAYHIPKCRATCVYAEDIVICYIPWFYLSDRKISIIYQSQPWD